MKNFNVNLTFTANTQQAKMQMADLQKSLNQLGNNPDVFGANMKKGLIGVKSTIDQVKIAFQQATDPTTGQINLNTLRSSLNAFGLDVHKIKADLGSMGVEGQMAFLKMQSAVQNAQMPLKRTETMLDKMWMTLKNTARWQMSSTALMAVTSTFSKAMQYAENLNESLNNIRIVTGYGTEEMSKFAKQANKAAKALSVSTTAYTDAALIYYQQGLSNEEVLKRADVTIKLANAVGESAKTVSEWMTAVWNNFDDGSKSLEYYADVMAALGAATASSADEIAQGLEKFAAIADTVGLSYEYATAALTTVTAQTRQSADVVGTAFKTMFARMQDLELGKTLEDGTSLGQYAETLDKVGVKVLDASGELRAMDAVLNDLGARWDKLSNAEQVAVAQGVAGIRQYSQMLALMDNWGDFQDNLFIAQSAEGSLDEQADIYAESWEAASKRVQASAQGIYDSILNDKVFIKFNNQIADMLEGVEYLVDAMGGLPGILSLVAAAMTKAFGPQMLAGMTNFKGFIADLTGQSAGLNKTFKENWARETFGLDYDIEQRNPNAHQAIQKTQAEQSQLDTKVQNLPYKLSPEAEAGYKSLRASVEQLGDSYIKWSVELDTATQQLNEQTSASGALTNINKEVEASEKQLAVAKQKLVDKGIDVSAVLKTEEKDLKKLTQEEQEYVALARNHGTLIEKQTAAKERNTKATEAAKGATERQQNATAAMAQTEKQYSEAVNQANAALDKQKAIMSSSQAWMNMATAVSSLSFGLSSLQSIISVLNNEDMSWGEKLLSILTSVSMTLPMVIMGIKAFNKETRAGLGLSIKSGLVKLGNVVPATKAEAKAHTEAARAAMKEAMANKKATAEDYKQAASSKINATANKTQSASQGAVYTHAKTGKQYRSFDDGKTFQTMNGRNATKWLDTSQLKLTKAGSGTSWGTALTKAGPALLAVGAIVAGVTLAVGAFKLFQKEYNKAENAAKEAAKHAKVMREEYTKVAEETKKMQEAFNAYDDAINKTRQLAKGTLEYKQALMEANEKAWDLINTYGLTTSDYKIVNGEVIISDEAKTRALEEQMNEQRKAQMASAQAQTNANSARVEASKVAAARKVDINDGRQEAGQATYGAVSGLGAGVLVGMGIGSFIPIVGPAVGALVGGLIGAITGGIAAGTQDAASETETKLVDDLTERALNNEDLSVEELQSSIDALKGATDEEVQALINTAQSNAKLIQANEALYDQIGLQIAEMRGIESEQSGVVGNWAKEADKRMDPLYDTLLEQLDDNDEQLQNLYALYNDGGRLENMAGDDITVRDKDGNLVGGGKNAFKQSDIAKQTIEKMRADIEANPDDYKPGSKKYEDLIKIAGSGNGGFAAMIQPILKEYGLLTEELEQDLAVSRERAQELGNFDIFKNNDAAKTAFLKQMDAVSRGEKGERLNLAEAGLSWQDIEKLEKDLYANWDEYDDTNVELEQAIKNYGEDIKTIVKEANNAFDVDTMLADQEASVQALAGIDAQVFATYVDSLENATGATDEFATELAKVNLTLESSVKSLGKNFKQYGKAFAKGDKTTEWSQGVTAIKKDLSNMFEGFEPDTAFTEALISSGQLSKLLDSENVEQDFLALMEQVTNAMVQQVKAPEDIRKTLQTEFERLKAEDLTQGTLLSSTDFNFDVFRNAAKDGNLDLEKFIQVLQAQGFRYTGDIKKLKEDGNLDYDSFEAKDFEFIGLGTANLIELIKGLNEEIDIDRYHDLEEALKDLSEATSYYGKVREKLYNENDSWWKKELAAARENIRLLEEYKKRAKAGIQIDYNEMIAASAGINGTPLVDKQGRITNYLKLQQANINNQEGWKAFYEALVKYEQTLNIYEEKSYAITEAKLEYLDQSIAYVAEEVEELTTLTEDSMKVLEFQFEHLGESAVDVAERIANIGQQMKATFANKDYYTQGLESLFDNYKDSSGKRIFGKNAYDKLLAGDLSFLKGKTVTKGFIEEIRSMRDGLIETYNALDGFKEKIQEEVISGFEKLTDEFEDNTKALEHNMKVLESYRNVIDLLGKDMLGISDEVLVQASAAAVNIAVAQMKGAKEQFEFAKNALAEAQANPELFNEEQLEKIQNSYREAELGLTETLAASIEAINTEFDNSLNAIMDNFDQAVGGIFGSLDKVQEWFDKYEELEDFYLKPYEKVYEINTLNREIQDAIQNSDNLKYQKELNKLSGELLEYQEEGVEMSDQDLEYMQRRFEVMKAQAAFEEAQNAKREVRLTRDSQGNYSYIYTANEEAVNKAQADLDKSIYELEKHFDEVQSSLSSMYLKTTKEYADAVAALDKTSATYEEDLKRVTDFYSQRLSQIEGEISESLIRAAKANEDYGTRAKTAFNELVIGQMYTDVKSFSDLHNEVVLPNIQSITNQATSIYNAWKGNVDKVFKGAGISVEDFGKKYAEVIGNKEKGTGIEGKTNELAKEFENLSSKASDTFSSIVDAASTEYEAFEPIIKKYKESLDPLLKNLTKLLTLTGQANGIVFDPKGSVFTPSKITIEGWGTYNGNKVVYSSDGQVYQVANDMDFGKESPIGQTISVLPTQNITDNIDNLKSVNWEAASGRLISQTLNKEEADDDNSSLNTVKITGVGVHYNPEVSEIPIPMVQLDNGDWYKQEDITKDDIVSLGQTFTGVNTKKFESYTSISNSGEKNYDNYYKNFKVIEEYGKGKGNVKIDGKWYRNDDYAVLQRLVGQPSNEIGSWVVLKPGSKGRNSEEELYDQPQLETISGFLDGIQQYKENGEAGGYHPIMLGGSTQEGIFNSKKIIGYKKDKGLYRLNEPAFGTYWLNEIDLQQLYHLDDKLKGTNETMWKHKNWYLKQLDTGGYTGVWGPEGRLAMLHQKEIVLNAHDTDNLLTTVQIVRSMADKLELSARVAQQGLGAVARISRVPGDNGVLEQNVTIHAEFPNATNHSEIEEAFRNLTNIAAQYASRR